MSIQWRTILVLNLFVVGLAAVQGYIARSTAAQVVEERLAWQMSAGVSAFLQSRTYPLSDTMMAYLKDIFHTDWVVIEGEKGLVASSLSSGSTREFRSQLNTAPGSPQATLGGQLYQVISQPLARKDVAHGRPESFRLYMLVPDEQLDAARNKAAARMFTVFLPAAATATIVAIFLSFTITRPVRQLVREMDTLAEQAVLPAPSRPLPSGATSEHRAPHPRASTEIARLAGSFHHLLSRLGAAQADLARSERLATLGKVCVSVAHEMRNPLSGIKMNVRVLKDELVGSTHTTGLDVMLREIDRMDLYLQELMNLSAAAPVRNVDPVALKISELAEGVLLILAGRCRHAGIEVTRAYSPDEPAVCADADRVRQCLINLLANAIEAMPGGGTLQVAVSPDVAGVRFSVTDRGGGVSIPAGEDVFDAFVSGKTNGVGLGLYLARQAIQCNGGQIGYESTPRGSTFWFVLPRAGSILEAPTRGISPVA